jgi:hypothetical protein
MSNDKKSQEFLAGKMKTLKKVKKELEKASRMHKGQADRIGKLL